MLGYAILGQLARQPLTGYELARRMGTPVGYFWSARHSQIYPALQALDADGLVSHRAVAGRGPRENKHYRVTAAGRHALRRWISSPLPPPATKSELMLRVRALWLVSHDEAVSLLRRARLHHVDRVATYLAEEEAFSAEDRADVAGPAFSAYATLRCGIGSEQQMVAWCDWLLAALEEPADQESAFHRSIVGVPRS